MLGLAIRRGHGPSGLALPARKLARPRLTRPPRHWPRQTFIDSRNSLLVLVPCILSSRNSIDSTALSCESSLQTQYTYDPYGNVTTSGTASQYPYLYQGMAYDALTPGNVDTNAGYSVDAEAFLAFRRDHLRVPRRIPHQVDVRFGNRRNSQ